MHYLANYLDESHPNLSNWNDDMNIIHDACIVNFGEINKGTITFIFFLISFFFFDFSNEVS